MPENDRPASEDVDMRLPKPTVEIVVDKNTVHKPGMKSYRMDDESEPVIAERVLGSEGYVVGGTVCSCDTVSTKSPGSSCPSYRSSGGGGSYGVCSCNTICTCNTIT